MSGSRFTFRRDCHGESRLNSFETRRSRGYNRRRDLRRIRPLSGIARTGSGDARVTSVAIRRYRTDKPYPPRGSALQAEANRQSGSHRTGNGRREGTAVVSPLSHGPQSAVLCSQQSVSRFPFPRSPPQSPKEFPSSSRHAADGSFSNAVFRGSSARLRSSSSTTDRTTEPLLARYRLPKCDRRAQR